jgi:hypothetical protein
VNLKRVEGGSIQSPTETRTTMPIDHNKVAAVVEKVKTLQLFTVRTTYMTSKPQRELLNTLNADEVALAARELLPTFTK